MSDRRNYNPFDDRSDTPFLDYIMGRTEQPPPPWDAAKHRRLVDHLWGTPMPPTNRSGPVTSFQSPDEAAEFHADVEAWLKEQR